MIFSTTSVPPVYKVVFKYFVYDIAWFGVLNGSILTFLSVYLTRIGASTSEVGVLSAAPAVIAVLFALPSGNWLVGKPIGIITFWASLVNRIFYLGLIPFALLFSNEIQRYLIMGMIILMSVPGTILVVGFNPLFGEHIPNEWRGYVAGLRNAAFAIVSMGTTLISGQILNRFPFTTGYLIIFALGFLGAMMSSFYLLRISRLKNVETSNVVKSENNQEEVKKLPGILHWEAITTHFKTVLILIFFFHLFQYLPIPLFPPFLVRHLFLTDSTISLGMTLFSLGNFLGSTQLAWLTGKFGNKFLVGFGLICMSTYPAMFALAHEQILYLVASITGGVAWSMAGGALFNYLLEGIPPQKRPGYFGWYNMVANLAILLGSTLGPAIGSVLDIRLAFWIFAMLRLIGGAAILRWG
ncbi:MAG TPA: MFS transporter [Anaerolineaceae bacterium]